MLTYLNKSEAAVVVLHEIYGLNQHIQDVCIDLSENHMDVFAPNMLESETVFKYNQENLAYDYFFKCIGIERAFDRINTLLRNIGVRYNKIFVVGFSVGATIAWLCSKEPDLCNAVIGFYGSRIRDYLNITPKCPVLLFFPTEEKSFNVSDLVGLVKTKDNVCVKQLYGQHGFANPSSPNYNKQSFCQAYQDMIYFINNN